MSRSLRGNVHRCIQSLESGALCSRRKNLSLCGDGGQCCGSGSDPDSMGSLDPYPDPIQEGKMTHKNRKKLINLIFWSAGCSLLRDEGFPCGLDLLYGGLGIRNCDICFKKDNFNPRPWTRIRYESGCWFRIRIQIRIQWIRIHDTGGGTGLVNTRMDTWDNA